MVSEKYKQPDEETKGKRRKRAIEKILGLLNGNFSEKIKKFR